ncbi:MAG: VOC family protein [Acidimicrobiales bacterium]
MPTRETAPTGAPCWVDLTTSDVDGARSFYGQLFGWEAEEANEEFGGYFNFTKDGVHVAGGMSSMPDAGMPDVWSVYLATDDARKAVDAVKANGGQVIADAMDVEDLGTMAVVTDSGGAAIGIWQPGLHEGFGLIRDAGTPAWFELLTRDYEGAVAFYETVFGWKTQTMGDTPDFRYTVAVDGEEQLAGVMDASGFLPQGVPNHWSVYFAADDADAMLAQVVALGGTVDTPAEDTPYGRLATAADPTGARFKIVAPNEAMPAP